MANAARGHLPDGGTAARWQYDGGDTGTDSGSGGNVIGVWGHGCCTLVEMLGLVVRRCGGCEVATWWRVKTRGGRHHLWLVTWGGVVGVCHGITGAVEAMAGVGIIMSGQ